MESEEPFLREAGTSETKERCGDGSIRSDALGRWKAEPAAEEGRRPLGRGTSKDTDSQPEPAQDPHVCGP